MDFFRTYGQEADFFCLQEVFSTTSSETVLKSGAHANIFAELSKVLSDFTGYFASFQDGHDINETGPVDFNLSLGLAIFARKTVPIKKHADFFVYGTRNSIVGNDHSTMPRNLEYLEFENHGKNFTLSNLHGYWYRGPKTDTEARLEQSRRIKQFLDRTVGEKILCGDFNLWPETESLHILEQGMKNLIKTSSISTTRSSLYSWTDKFADYTLVSPGVQVVRFEVLQDTVSDHLPLMLEFN